MTEFSAEQAIERIIGDFDAKTAKQERAAEEKEMVGFWIRGDRKAKYDRLQRASGQMFGKKLLEMLELAIDLAKE